MIDFKTYFNPIVAFLRIVFSLLFASLVVAIVYVLITQFQSNSIKQNAILIIGGVLFSAGFKIFFKEFLTTTKNYTINDNFISEYNFLTLTNRKIYKSDIKGFSTSKIPYRMWDFKQVIIYLNDGQKIDIMQFAYFNFKEIKQALLDRKFEYLGHEPYKWKWVNSREYRFD